MSRIMGMEGVYIIVNWTCICNAIVFVDAYMLCSNLNLNYIYVVIRLYICFFMKNILQGRL